MDDKFLASKGILAHHYCSHPFQFKPKLAPSGVRRDDIVQLAMEYLIPAVTETDESGKTNQVPFLHKYFEASKDLNEATKCLQKLNCGSFVFLKKNVESLHGDERAYYLEQCKKVFYEIFQDLKKAGQYNSSDGILTICNTSLDETNTIRFMQIMKHKKPLEGLTPKEKAYRQRKAKHYATLIGVILPVTNANAQYEQECFACERKPIRKATVASESAFYSDFRISHRIREGYKRFCSYHNADIFQPSPKVTAHINAKATVEIEQGMIPLLQNKSDVMGKDEPVSVPFFQVKDFKVATTQHLLNLDKHYEYRSFQYHKSDERLLVAQGDLGQDLTKFGFSDTHRNSALSGKEFKIWHSFEKAADTYPNLEKCYKDKIAPGYENLQQSSIVRISHNKVNYCAAIVPSPNPAVLPTMFMAYNEEKDLKFSVNGDLFFENDWMPSSGQNLASFIKVVRKDMQDGNAPAYILQSVVTVNLGGPQISKALWAHIASFLSVKSKCNQCSRQNLYSTDPYACSCKKKLPLHQ